jgi:hypothetical protein
MSGPRLQQMKDEILRALQEVARRFEEDPSPTDGSFEAACKKMGIRTDVRVYRPTIDKKRAK